MIVVVVGYRLFIFLIFFFEGYIFIDILVCYLLFENILEVFFVNGGKKGVGKLLSGKMYINYEF